MKGKYAKIDISILKCQETVSKQELVLHFYCPIKNPVIFNIY